MDLWLKPTNENRDKFIKALREKDINKSMLDAIYKLDFTEPQVNWKKTQQNRFFD